MRARTRWSRALSASTRPSWRSPSSTPTRSSPTARSSTSKRPDVVQPATGLIDDYIKIITKLLDTGYAYIAGGNVYFDTSKLSRYYIFNDHNEEDLAVGVREGVEEDENKKNKNDFVLWFTKSKFEDQALKWDSPGASDIRAGTSSAPAFR